MATYLDEAAIMGVIPKGAAPVSAAVSKGAVFLDEAAITGEEPWLTEARKGPSKVELAADIGKRALSLTAATGDLLLGVPGAIAGHLMNVGTRLYAAAKGEPSKLAGQAGELAENLGSLSIPGTDVKIPLEGLKTPLQTILKATMGVEPWNQEIVAEAIEAAGRGIEKASAGKVTSEDVKLGFGIFMDTAGAAGLRAGAKIITAKPKPGIGKDARATYVEEAPRGEPSIAESPIASAEAPFRQQMPEILTKAEQAKVRRTRAQELKDAFKDAEQVDYLKFKSDEAMEGRAAELVKEAEAKGRDTSPYDQAALGEEVSRIVNEKPGHERTAEDLIKIREWNRQAFRSQQGRVDPDMLPYIVAGLTGVIGAVPLYNYLKHLGGTDPKGRDEGLFQIGTLGAGVGAAMGVIKGKGGAFPVAKGKIIPKELLASEYRRVSDALVAAHQDYANPNKASIIKALDAEKANIVSQFDRSKAKVSPESKLEDKINALEDRISNAENADIPNDNLISRLEKQRDDLQSKLDQLEGGAVDPKLLAALGFAGGGAALGTWVNEDHPIKGAAYGAGIGLLLSRANPRAWAEAYKRAQQTGSIVRIEDLVRQFGYEGRVLNRSISQMAGKILAVAKDPVRREAIYDFLEGERPTKLSLEEQKVAKEIREFLDVLGSAAKGAKVIPYLIADYVTRIRKSPSVGAFGTTQIGGIKTSSPFGIARVLKERGDVITDIAQVVQIYAESVGRAVAGQELVNALRVAKTPEGIPLVAKAGKAPPGYVRAPGEQLRDYLVHPDIAPDVNFIFQAYKPGAILGTLDAINSTQKRMGVSLSLFHATALEQALLGAVSIFKSPKIGLKALGQGFAPRVFGESLAVRMIREGGQGDAVDFALKSGLEVSLERLGPAIAEERPGMYKGLEVATKFLDETVPGLGKYTTGTYLKLNRMFDEAMWARFQATLKLETFWDRQAALERNNAKAFEAGRIEKMPSKEELGRKTASFTNDMYGGLNWYTLVSEVTSRWGREIASAVFSAPGRFAQRMTLFAPDWTLSTTRAFAKSFGPLALAASAGAVVGSQYDTETTQSQLLGGAIGAILGTAVGKMRGLKVQTGSGLRGLLQPRELADLHRQYFLRSALIYSTLVDAANYQMSGHHFWENKDPTRLDRGDGTTMQASKHFVEPFHWLIDPKKQAMGKASFLIKETASQLSDMEYWSPHGAPRMGDVPKGQNIPIGKRLEHAAKQFAPISAQGFELDNPEKAGWSMIGMPVYGKTYKERARLKAQQKRERASPAYKRKLMEKKRQLEREKRQRGER